MCQDHPFHTLYNLYCLQTYQNAESNTQSQVTSQTLIDRSNAAKEVLGQLRASAIASRVKDVETVCTAYVQWATEAINKPTSKVEPSIPSKMKILTLFKLKVPVLTAHTEIDRTLRYDNCVWIERYYDKYSTAGGVNLPKISICYGSDGLEYKQLVCSDAMSPRSSHSLIFQCNSVQREG